MAMTETQRQDDGLEAFFAVAREAAPEPSTQFLMRLIAQGEAVQAERQSAAMAPPRPIARGARGGGILAALAALAAALGGWGAMGGMVSAAVAGVWIGFAGSETMLQAVGFESATQATATATSAFLPEADILALATGQ